MWIFLKTIQSTVFSIIFFISLHNLDRLCISYLTILLPTVFLVWSYSLLFLLAIPHGALSTYVLSDFCLGIHDPCNFICGNVFVA